MSESTERLFLTPASIQAYLSQILKRLIDFEACAFLDYPYYSNVGDHLIWCGAGLALHRLNVEVRYVASQMDFSQHVLNKKAPNLPILFTGGGNLGDLWPDHQIFREYVICRNPNRKIIIFPQSVFFQ